MSSNIWMYFARPVDILLGFADDSEIWIQGENAEAWKAFRHTIEWLRDIASNSDGWKCLLGGNLDRCVPQKVRLSGNLDLAPVMWISTDATLRRIGPINWHSKQFISIPVGGLFAPFAKKTTRSIHISDVALLSTVIGMVAWLPQFKGTALNIADNLNAIQWIASQKSQHGVALQILRPSHKWIVEKTADFDGLYARSPRNVPADHLDRLTYAEIENWPRQTGFGWISPFSVNNKWKAFIEPINLGNEREAPSEGTKRPEEWRRDYGWILDWGTGASEVSQMCRKRGAPMWVSAPKHSVVDMWRRATGINVWNLHEAENAHVFPEVGLANRIRNPRLSVPLRTNVRKKRNTACPARDRNTFRHEMGMGPQVVARLMHVR